MPSLSETEKVGIARVCCGLFLSNYWVGATKFKKGWSENRPDIEKYFDARNGTLDWDGIVKSLRLSVSIFLPGVPFWLASILSILLFMLLGLSLRKAYPVFSVFAGEFHVLS